MPLSHYCCFTPSCPTTKALSQRRGSIRNGVSHFVLASWGYHAIESARLWDTKGKGCNFENAVHCRNGSGFNFMCRRLSVILSCVCMSQSPGSTQTRAKRGSSSLPCPLPKPQSKDHKLQFSLNRLVIAGHEVVYKEENSMDQYRSRLKLSENFERHWSIPFPGEIHMDQSLVHTFSWQNSYGPMVLKVLLKFPPTQVW